MSANQNQKKEVRRRQVEREIHSLGSIPIITLEKFESRTCEFRKCKKGNYIFYRKDNDDLLTTEFLTEFQYESYKKRYQQKFK